MVRYVRHLFTGLTLAAALSCAVFASAQTIYVTAGARGATNAGIFGTLDPTTGVFSQIGGAITELSGLAFSPTGVLYGVSTDATTIYTINPNTGVLSTVGSTGAAVGSNASAGGLAFSSAGTLYLTNQVSNLFTVNTGSGAATLVGNLGAGNASSGTISFDGTGTTLFETNNDPGGFPASDPGNGSLAGNDVLENVSLVNGAATRVGSPGTDTGFAGIFGLAFSNGILYGFTDTNTTAGTGNGDIIVLNTSSGIGTPVLAGPATYTLPGARQIILGATAGTPGAVPEPSTLALLVGMGVTGTSVFLRRKRSNPSA